MQSLKEDLDSTAHTSLTPTTPCNVTHEQDLDDGPANCGVRIGKLRISDRIGGAFYPITREEVSSQLAVAKNDVLIVSS